MEKAYLAVVAGPQSIQDFIAWHRAGKPADTQPDALVHLTLREIEALIGKLGAWMPTSAPSGSLPLQ